MKKLLITLLLTVGFMLAAYGAENGPAPLVTTGSVSGLGTIATIDSPVPIANGGTGKTTAAEALTALGGASLNGSSTVAFNASTINGTTPGTMLGEAATDYVATDTFTAHTGATGSAVHGLGTISTKAATDYVATDTFTGHTGATGSAVHGLGTISTVNSPVPVANGGTGATTAAEALAALGGASLNGSSTVDFLTEDLGASGFSTLGEAATGIKMKVLTGTTAAAEGGTVEIAHGVTASKIVLFTAIVKTSADAGFWPEYQENAGYQFSLLHDSTKVIIKNNSTNSENILEKDIVATVWYKE